MVMYAEVVTDPDYSSTMDDSVQNGVKKVGGLRADQVCDVCLKLESLVQSHVLRAFAMRFSPLTCNAPRTEVAWLRS